jgi:prepilin-type N-terminal cleavage/methylation domain-containing protein
MRTKLTNQAGRRGFTLAETLVSIMIMGLVFSAVLVAYTRGSQWAEWSGLSLAAESLCVREMEQVRAVKWDTQSVPIYDDTVNVPTSNTMILDIPISGSNVVYATNTLAVSSFTQSGPSYFKMVIATTTWAWNGVVFSNTLVDYRAPDQ